MATDYGGSSFVTTNIKLWLQVMVAVLLLLQILNYGYRLVQLCHYDYRLRWRFCCYYKYKIMATDYGGSYFVTTNMKL